jgi:squalene-hopene/tetraprenyl-beta-curcumene cyclase
LIFIMSTASPAAEPTIHPTKPAYQYEFGSIRIQAASDTESRIKNFSGETLVAAAKYLDDGALAWAGGRKCIACHTTGAYMAERPALTAWLGPPRDEIRVHFVTSIPSKLSEPQLDQGIRYYRSADRAVWCALGLATWDKYVEGRISEATVLALREMLARQSSHGGYHVVGEVEIPYVTTDLNLSIQAIRAIANAPGWLEHLEDPSLLERIEKLKEFVRRTPPLNDYDRLLQLQAASSMPKLIEPSKVTEVITMLLDRQSQDGGWSTRDFSSTDGWQVSVSPRVKDLLDNLPDADAPASDAYLTSFAIVLLIENGRPLSDPQLQRGLAWLRSEQRQSGRWWMHSLYRGNYHFTTYLATAQAMRALAIGGEFDQYLTRPAQINGQ